MKTVKTIKSKTSSKTSKTTAKTVGSKAPAVKAAASPAPKPAVKARTVKSAPVKTPAILAVNSRREVTSDIIAARAYTIWEQRGRPQGSELENWLLAEDQLKQEQSFTA